MFSGKTAVSPNVSDICEPYLNGGRGAYYAHHHTLSHLKKNCATYLPWFLMAKYVYNILSLYRNFYYDCTQPYGLARRDYQVIVKFILNNRFLIEVQIRVSASNPASI